MRNAEATTATATDARRALLARLIDHAPLFPPASLPVEEALADHERARTSDAAWIVNRFVAPASRLSELADPTLRVSVVADADVPDDPRIEAVELPPGTPADPFVHAAPEVYAELAPDADVDRLPVRAKVRCGGQIVPTAGALARFIRACRAARVPFKATAGLHHAVRTDAEHGFLNLLAACAFGDEERALEERDAAAFALDAEAFAWRDRSADAPALAAVRRELFVSIGSCSFTEPIDELRALGMLPP